jgi:molybdopterin-guanine dinucleotide biosynthesis protein A
MRIFKPSRVSATGYILVGGASSRFGKDKALVEFNGITMIERMKALLIAMYMPEIWLVGDPEKYAATGISCIPDRFPGEGPLGGILTALRWTEEQERPRMALLSRKSAPIPERNFILSCDMPFLSKEWMEAFFLRSLESKADVVVPKSSFGLEPLCACWRTAARPLIEEQFKRGVRKVTAVFEHLKTEVLDESDWKRFDTEGRLFWNMNTLADYEEARRVFAQRAASG